MNILATRRAEALNGSHQRHERMVAVAQILTGGLMLYLLCTYAALVIELITQAGMSTVGIILLSAVGVSGCDVAGVLLIWLGLVRLRQSLFGFVVPIPPPGRRRSS